MEMTITAFLLLVEILTAVNTIVVQAMKKLLDEAGAVYSSNRLASICGAVVGAAGTVIYYIMAGIRFDAVGIVYIILMAIAIGLTSMGFYDKVIQMIQQIQKVRQAKKWQ